MDCPHHKQPLLLQDREGHSGYVCRDCRGTWLTFDLIKSIQQRREFSPADFIRHIATATVATTALPCPQSCTPPLRVAYIYDIQLDWCPSCHGVWLDHGELEKLLARLPRPPDGADKPSIGSITVLDVLAEALQFLMFL